MLAQAANKRQKLQRLRLAVHRRRRAKPALLGYIKVCCCCCLTPPVCCPPVRPFRYGIASCVVLWRRQGRCTRTCTYPGMYSNAVLLGDSPACQLSVPRAAQQVGASPTVLANAMDRPTTH
jgi:hypothetical protein